MRSSAPARAPFLVSLPGDAADVPGPPDAGGPDPAAGAVEEAAGTWAALAPVVAGGGLRTGRVRVSRDGGRAYPRSCERALTAALPVGQPAAVRVYDDDGLAGCLSVDLDVSRGGQEQVDRDADTLLALVAWCGGRVFSDRSPTGGRHVYLPLARPVGYDELRPVLFALAQLLPSLDVAPGVNLLAGCIRPPGARHKSGGWQRLDGPLHAAVALARSPNPPAVWAALCAALGPQLGALRPAQPDPSVVMPAEAAGAAGPKERAARAEPAARPGGPRPLRPAVLTTARSGRYDTGRYLSPSEARQGVLAAAAASGWTYADVLEQLHAGRWPGLASCYARYADRHRGEALAGDWLRAAAYARTPQHCDDLPPAGELRASHVHSSDTREPTTHRGALDPTHSATEFRSDFDESGLPTDGYRHARAWWTAVRLAERDRHAGRGGHSARLVLRALGNAAQKTGRRHLAFGVRSLAIAAGLSRTTVAATLRVLREADDPLVVLLDGGRGLAGDLYQLRVPDRYLERARTDPWRPGRIQALLPVFRVLGTAAAFTYEVLDNQPQTSWDLAATALLSTRATQHALTELAAYGLAVRDQQGWRRGPADPHQVAVALGADRLATDQAARYRIERTAWQTRIGASPGPTVEQILTAPPAVRESELGPRPWAPQQPQPPPDPTGGGSEPPDSEVADRAALHLVAHVLGGTVLRG